MKKLVLVSVLIFQLYHPQQIYAQTDSLSDVFPLSIGKEWVYSFNLVSSTAGGGSSTDTGFVNYRILNNTFFQNTTIWHMQATRSL